MRDSEFTEHSNAHQLFQHPLAVIFGLALVVQTVRCRDLDRDVVCLAMRLLRHPENQFDLRQRVAGQIVDTVVIIGKLIDVARIAPIPTAAAALSPKPCNSG